MTPTVKLEDESDIAIVTTGDETESDDNSSNNNNLDLKPESKRKRFKKWLLKGRKFLRLEPVMLLHGIAAACTSVIIQNLYIERVCRVTYNFTQQECDNLTAYPDKEKFVEATTANIGMYRNLIDLGFPIIIALFLGAWSDKHGSKWMIVLSLLGTTVSCSLYVLFSYLTWLPAHYILLTSLPTTFTGGLTTFIIATFSHVTKMSSARSRSFRISVLGQVWNAGDPIGYILGAQIFLHYGFHNLFLVSTCLFSCAVLYAAVMLKNRNGPPTDTLDLHQSNSRCFKDLCSTDAVKDTINTVLKRRPGNKRKWIILLTICICLQFLSYAGPSPYNYLFARNRFGWTTEKYSNYSTAKSLSGIIGGFVVMFVTMKIFKLSDSVIGGISVLGNLASCFVMAFASEDWMLYLASIIQMFGYLLTYIIRSMASQCVEKDEVGKLFCITTSLELSMPFVAGPLFNLAYVNTEFFFPGAMYLLSAGLNFVVFVIFVFAHKSRDTFTQSYSPLQDENRNQPFTTD